MHCLSYGIKHQSGKSFWIWPLCGLYTRSCFLPLLHHLSNTCCFGCIQMLVLFEDSILTWPVIWFAVSLMTVLFTLYLQIVQLHDYIMWLVFSLMSMLFTLCCLQIALLLDHIMWLAVCLILMLFTLWCSRIIVFLDYILWLASSLMSMLFELCLRIVLLRVHIMWLAILLMSVLFKGSLVTLISHMIYCLSK